MITPPCPSCRARRLLVALLWTFLAVSVFASNDAPATGSRASALDAFASHGDAAFRDALTGAGDMAAISLPGGQTWVGTLRVPALPEGGLLTFGVGLGGYTASAESSADSTDGRDGAWSALPLTLWLPGESGHLRLQKLELPASEHPVWVRLAITNPSATSATQVRDVELHAFAAGGNDDYWLAIGASITRTSTSHALFKQSVRERFGAERDPVVFNLATGGSITHDWVNGSPNLLEQALALHPKARYVLVHVGGNNVSNNRPFDEADSRDVTVRAHLRQIYQTILDAGRRPIPLRLSFRDYKTAPLVNGGANPENGSLPYNVNIVDPLIAELAPEAYDFAAGRGRVDPYTYLLGRQELLDADGIHLNQAGREAWTRDILAAQAGAIVYPAPPLRIVTQPAPVVVYAGHGATFRVEAVGDAPACQWIHNGIAIPGATSPVLELGGVQADDAGWYQVAVTDAAGGAVLSDRVTLTLATSSAIRTWLFDFGSSGSVMASPDAQGLRWNNLTSSATGAFLSAPVWTSGVAAAGTTLTITDGFSGINTAGSTVDGAFPANPSRDSFYVTGTGSSGSKRTAVLTLSGLDAGAAYGFTFFAARSGSGSRQTRFTVAGGTPVFLEAINNTHGTASVAGVRPDASGRIVIEVAPYDAGGVLQEYGYLNAMNVTESLPQADAYAVWTSAHALPVDLSGEGDDADGDGVANLVEFALGGDPRSAGTRSPEPALLDDAGRRYLLLDIARDPTATGLDYVVEVTDDLTLWQAGVGHTLTLVDSPERLCVRDDRPLTAGVRRFMRLRITRP